MTLKETHKEIDGLIDDAEFESKYSSSPEFRSWFLRSRDFWKNIKKHLKPLEMKKIQCKENQPKVELNGELMMKAYADAEKGIEQGAYKSNITMGIVEIDETEYLLTVSIEQR